MKTFQILLDKTIIGTTLLEKADPPMGVVFGAIQFSLKESPYDYFYHIASAIMLTQLIILKTKSFLQE